MSYMYKNDVGKGGSKLMNLMKSDSLAPTATEARDFKGILGSGTLMKQV